MQAIWTGIGRAPLYARSVVVLTLLLALLGVSAKAQTDADAPPRLRMGWVQAPGFSQPGEDGRPEGFAIDLANRIADRAGVELEFVQFHNVSALLAAHNANRIDMIVGAMAHDRPEGTGATSIPVSHSETRLFLLHRAPLAQRLDDIRDNRLAMLVGTAPNALTRDNQIVRFTSPGGAVGALMTGEVEGLIAPADSFWPLMAQAGFDDQITAHPMPLGRFDRVVALAAGHEDLLTPINREVTELEAEGVLDRMRARWNLIAPQPPPHELTVGVYHFPPYTVVNEDGTFTGLSVEIFRNLAKRASLHYRFVEIDYDAWRAGPGLGGYDILPQVGVSAARAERMDFSAPTERSEFAVFAAVGQLGYVQALADLSGLRVGVVEGNLGRRFVADIPGVTLVTADGVEGLVDLLEDDLAEAIIYPRATIEAELAQRSRPDAYAALALAPLNVDRAVALRPGLGHVLDRINTVIPGYLGSEQYHDLRLEWLADPPYWTQSRINRAAVVGGILLATLAVMQMLQGYRFRLTEAEHRVATELIDRIPLGLVLLDPSGRIIYCNSKSNEYWARGHDPIFAPDKSYREAAAEMISDGIVIKGVEHGEEMLDVLTTHGLEDGYVCELLDPQGQIGVRLTRVLSDGRILLMRRDVTEERRRLHLIRDLNRDLAEQNKLARASNDELRSFAFATSHDLKAPTNTALMLLEELKAAAETPRSEAEHQAMDDLQDTLCGMRQLIDDVLAYTNTVESPVGFERVDLSDIFDDCLRDLRADIDQCGARLSRDALPVLQASPPQMRQLMLNLLSNALKFRDPRTAPVIEVRSANARGGYVGFGVHDNGIGIDPSFHDRIFQLFQRLHPASRYPGSGLGLSICHRIALNHRGRIRLNSRPGAGASFTVELKEINA